MDMDIVSYGWRRLGLHLEVYWVVLWEGRASLLSVRYPLRNFIVGQQRETFLMCPNHHKQLNAEMERVKRSRHKTSVVNMFVTYKSRLYA